MGGVEWGLPAKAYQCSIKKKICMRYGTTLNLLLKNKPITVHNFFPFKI